MTHPLAMLYDTLYELWHTDLTREEIGQKIYDYLETYGTKKGEGEITNDRDN